MLTHDIKHRLRHIASLSTTLEQLVSPNADLHNNPKTPERRDAELQEARSLAASLLDEAQAIRTALDGKE